MRFHQANVFENFRKFSNTFGWVKPHMAKKWPKSAIKMKISGVDETPQKASSPKYLK